MNRVLVVVNETSGSSEQEVLRHAIDELRPIGRIEVLSPSSKEAFDDEVGAAAASAAVVITAGGDGTLNCIVNALEERLDEITLGLVPMGTGNDFARTLGIPGDPIEAARAIAGQRTRSVDVARVTARRVDHLFINACMGGFPVEVVEALDDDTKRRLGPLAFWVGGAKALGGMEKFVATINGERVEECAAVGIGNGRTAGGGIEVMPGADPSDGLLDACAFPITGPAQAIALAARVKSGGHTEMESVPAFRAPEFQIEADPAIEFNVDGDLIGLESPAHFRVAARATFLVGHQPDWDA